MKDFNEQHRVKQKIEDAIALFVYSVGMVAIGAVGTLILWR